MPKHSDIDPAVLKSILPMVGLIEIGSTAVAPFRLAGSGLRDLFGFDPTGQNAVDLSFEDQRRRRSYRLFVPATASCGYLGESAFTLSGGLTDLFESIGLPIEPSGPGGYPMVIFTLESLRGRRWLKTSGAVIDNPENYFRFIDIGAGELPPVDAPDDFVLA